jgi:hypothetical protein
LDIKYCGQSCLITAFFNSAKAKDFLEKEGYMDVFNAYSIGHIRAAMGSAI